MGRIAYVWSRGVVNGGPTDSSPAAICLLALPSSPPLFSPFASPAPCLNNRPPPHLSTQSKWRVVTQTSNLSGAGTDATVSIQVWGPKGMLGGSEQPLNTSKNDFERNEVDTFFLDVPRERECGYPLEKVGNLGGGCGKVREGGGKVAGR